VELSRELFRYVRTMRAVKGRLAHGMDSGTEFQAMGLLFYLKCQGPIRQADVAAGSLLDPSTVSRQVRRLVQDGLVERRADPLDGRAVRLAVSEDGEHALSRALVLGRQYVSECVGRWDTADIRTLTALLHRLSDDLERRIP